MSKGTKQIRLGRVASLLTRLEIRAHALESAIDDADSLSPSQYLLKGKYRELTKVIAEIKEEFDL